jgi:hypothetical protein
MLAAVHVLLSVFLHAASDLVPPRSTAITALQLRDPVLGLLRLCLAENVGFGIAGSRSLLVRVE